MLLFKPSVVKAVFFFFIFNPLWTNNSVKYNNNEIKPEKSPTKYQA